MPAKGFLEMRRTPALISIIWRWPGFASFESTLRPRHRLESKRSLEDLGEPCAIRRCATDALDQIGGFSADRKNASNTGL
jgi:hypothetical protein